MSEIEYPQRIRGGAGWFPKEGEVELEGYKGARIRLTEGQSPNGNGIEIIEFEFAPIWKLQSASVQPDIADGILKGFCQIAHGMVDIIIEHIWGPNTKDGVPSGSGTSRYYYIFPANVPSSSHMVSGTCGSWNGGTGEKEFDGRAFFSRPYPERLQMNLEGEAVGVTRPKTWEDKDYIVTQLRYRKKE